MVRGSVTPVVSLPIMLGQPGGAESRFVATRSVTRECILAVDAVEQISQLGAEVFQPMPPLLQGIAAAQAVAAKDRDFIMTLNFAFISNLLPPMNEVPA